MPRIRSTTLSRLHLDLGRATPPPAALKHYSQRHGIGHLVVAGAYSEAKERLLSPAGLLGLQAHAELWDSVYGLGAALWPDGMASPLLVAGLEALRCGALDTSEDYCDAMLEVFRELGAYPEGLELARARFEQAKSMYGPGHLALAIAQHNLALALEATGAVDAAIGMSRAAVASFDHDTLAEPSQVAAVRAGLSLVLMTAGRFDEAVAALEGYADDQASVAAHNYASALREAGRTTEAIGAFKSVIAAREEYFGLHHSKTDGSRVGLADALRGAHCYAQARVIYEEVLPRQRRLFGDHHTTTESTLNGLAIVLHNLEEHASARPVLEQLYQARTLRLGADHRNTVMTLHNLGHNHLATGDLAAAEDCFRRVHEVDRRQRGLSHSDTAMSLSAVADVQAARGDFDQALSGWIEAAEIMGRALGPSHPNSAWAQATVGVGLARKGRFKDSLPYLEKAVELMVAGHGGHDQQAAVRHSLAVCLEKLGHFERCVQVVQDLCCDHRALGDDEAAEQSRRWLDELKSKLV